MGSSKGKTVALALLVAAGVAGCADGPEAPGFDALEPDDVEVSIRHGAISGVVVDEAIVPLAGANVTIEGRPGVIRTNPSGQFSAVRLEPGAYIVRAQQAGYESRQTVAKVEAGTVSKPRLVLPLDTSVRPYHQTMQFNGYTDLAFGEPSRALDVIVLDSVGVTTCECTWPIALEGPWETIIIEVFWEDTVPNPTEETRFFWQISFGGEDELARQSRPVRGEIDPGKWPDGPYEGWFRVYPESYWPYVGQSFQAFLTTFYGAPAPDGWTLEASE